MTHNFTDKEGLVWPLSLNLETAEFIEASDFSLLHEGPVSLLQPSEQFMRAMYTNLPLVYALAFAACHETAEKHSIDQQAFKRRLHGQAMLELKEAWHAELIDFFPQMKTVLSRLKEMYLDLPQKAVARITAEVESRLPGMTEQAEKEIESQIDRLIAGLSSEQLQPSPESTTGEPSLTSS